jgi:Tol biopolymer transport system component/DNA-binding winged helix-turn-helix (wHTH) protein
MFHFGAFDLSTDRKELRKNGLLIRLSPQPFQVLCLLLENAGELVTRDELRTRLWGDQTNVEFDAGVNRCIRQIRAVLNDDSEFPRYVETVPRQGYRFIGALGANPQALPAQPMATMPVQSLKVDSLPLEPSHSKDVAPEPGSNLRRFLIPAIGALVILGIGVLWLMSDKPKHPVELIATPLAVALGDQYAPTFSPDGQRVAFAWNGERRNHFDIYVKEINSPAAPLRLTSNEDINYSPAWSPDGRSIAFYRREAERVGGIWVIGALGGPARKIADLDSLVTPNGREIAWLPDSRSLIVAVGETQNNHSQIVQIDVETGERKTLLAGAATEHYMTPSVSPDGRTLAFTRDVGPGTSSIMLLALPGGTPRVLKAQESAKKAVLGMLNRYPAWTPDGKYIVFSSDSGGRDHLWLAPAEGDGPPEELGALGDGISGAWISSLGALAFVHEDYDTNIWRLDLNRSVSDPAPNPAQVVSSTRLESNPSLSPDGRRLAFASNQSGYTEIWIGDVDGTNAAPLTSMNAANTGSPDWSPDGKQIVFDSRAEGRPHIYVINAGGGKFTKLTTSMGVVPHWSPDGKWIYYSSDSSGRMEIWRVPSSGGTPERVTRKGGFAGILSPDGRFLYHASDNGPSANLWRMEMATGSDSLVAESVLNRAYALAAGSLYYVQGQPDTDDHSLFLYDLHTKKPKLLFQLQHRIERGVALSADGQSLYYTGIDRANHELRLVNHFWK